MSFETDGFYGPDEYDGLRISVMSLREVMEYMPGPDEVCISIHTDYYGYAKPELLGFVDVLRLNFDDTAVDRLDDKDAIPYTREMANQVAKFVLKHRDKKKLVIHCFAGISRSRTMAAAIAHVLDLPFRFTIKNMMVGVLTAETLIQLLDAEGDGQI